MTNLDIRQPLSAPEDSLPARPDWGGVGAGIVFLALAAVALYAGRDLPRMRAFAMGASTFPYVLAVLLGVLGAIVLIEGLMRRSHNIGRLDIVPTVVVVVAGVAFALMIKPFGFIVAGGLAGAIVGLYSLRTRLGILILVLFISLAAVIAVTAPFDVPIQWWPSMSIR